MKQDFKAVTTRDKKAAEYFGSEAFLEQMETAVERAIIKAGRNRAYVPPVFAIKPQDKPYVDAAFTRLKEKYPELNHVYVNKGLSTGIGIGLSLCFTSAFHGELVIDTKKGSFHRRVSNALCARPNT